MTIEMILLVLILLAGFYMAWSIGANDVANAMGTSVGSAALTLKQAVIIAAVLEFSGAFFFGSHVSDTIENGIIKSSIFAEEPMLLVYGMLASLLATAAWLQLASYFGWPVSGTHAIVGAVVGFGVVIGGTEAIYWGNVGNIVLSWVISPLSGGLLGYLIFSLLRNQIFYTANPIQSAQKITPILVFFVLTMLSFIMIFKGLNNLHFQLSIYETVGICIGIGLIGSLVSYFFVRRMIVPVTVTTKSRTNPEILVGLDKASKHLSRVAKACSGETQYQVISLMEEVNSVTQDLKHPEEMHDTSAEYAVVEKIFGFLQIISACLMAFAHGANDVANAIGPLSASINVLRTGVVSAQTEVPTWALALGGFGIVVGLATWGWRVIETIGKKITELTPTRGFAAEFGAAITILIASRLGMPISTTHTLVGAVIGVGLARGIEALNLGMTRDIILSWVVTIPISTVITVAFFFALKGIFG